MDGMRDPAARSRRLAASDILSGFGHVLSAHEEMHRRARKQQREWQDLADALPGEAEHGYS